MVSPEGVLRKRLLAKRTLQDLGIVLPGHNGLFQALDVFLGAREGPEEAAGGLVGRRWRRVCEQLSQARQTLLQSTDFQIGLVDLLPANVGEGLRMAALESAVVVVAIAALVAGFADSAPEAPDWLVLGGAGELHLVHGVLIAEQLPAVAAVDVAVCGAQSFAAERVGAGVVARGALPVGLGNGVIGINDSRVGRRRSGSGSRGRRGMARRYSSGVDSRGRRAREVDNAIRFKDIEAFELLVENGERLELLGLFDLLFKPVLDFVLFGFLEILVVVVQVSKRGKSDGEEQQATWSGDYLFS